MNLKQKLALVLGLLFVISLSADPIIHSFVEDEHHHEVHESSDCQVCETESFKAYALKVIEEYALITNISINSEKDHVSPFSADFSARAPPNS